MSNLLEKASIVTTPTAYDNGKILSVKPAPSLSSELITNGDFSDGTNDWSFDNVGGTKGWRIADNRAICDVSGASNGRNLQQYLDISITSGKKYKVSLDILQSEDSILLFIGGQTVTLPSGTNVGYETTFVATSTSTLITFFASTSDTQEIDNISIKEQTDADFDFTRGSSATRVNSQGLIEDVQILSSNLVSNGDFSQEGSELVTNGDFATDSDWNKDNSWTISEGAANYNYISERNINSASASLVIGKSYKLVYTVLNHSSGYVINDSAETRPQRNSNGTYTEVFTARYTFFRLRGSVGGVFSIDNVSVKEVGQDWTVTNDDANNYVEFNQDEGTVRLKFLNTSPLTTFTSNTQYLSGKKYKLIVDVKEAISGGVKIDAAGVSELFNSVGVQERIIEPTGGANISFYRATADVDITLNSVSLIEITDDTNLPRINYEGFSYQDALGSEQVVNGDFATDSNWTKLNSTISGGTGNLNGTGVTSMLYQNILTNGKTYKATFTVSDYNGLGESRVIDSSGSAIYTITSNGTFTFTFTHSNDGNFLFRARNGGIFSVDNVSVKEYLGQEVVPDSGRGSWLFEPQSTNIIPYSKDFSQSTWTKQNNATVASNSTTSPNGEIDADLLNCPTTSRLLSSISVTNGVKYTFSIFIKKGTSSLFSIDLYDGGSNSLIYNFDTNVVSGGVTDNSIEDYGNGWHKLSGTITTASTTLFCFIYGNGGYSENEANTYIWGAQLEQNSFSTSYIPTEGSIKTRLQDAAFGAGSSDLINSTEGVLYFEGERLSLLGSKRTICISDGSLNNYLYIQLQGVSNTVRIFYKTIETGQALLLNHNLSNELEFRKYAFRWSNNNFSLWINGIKEIEQLNGNTATSSILNQINFSLGNGADKFFGKTKCLAVFKEALTDEELECLTTI